METKQNANGREQQRVSLPIETADKVRKFADKESRPISNALAYLVIRGLEVLEKEVQK